MLNERETAFNEQRPRLIRACQGYLGGFQAEAADIVQDAFMMVCQEEPMGLPRPSNGTWLLQVCRQLCSARLRDRTGIVRCLEPELDRARLYRAVERVGSDNLEVQKQQWVGLLREAVKPLSLEARQVLNLRHVKGLTYAQIGTTLGLSWSEVAQRLAAARLELRSSIGGLERASLPANLTRGPWGLVPA